MSCNDVWHTGIADDCLQTHCVVVRSTAQLTYCKRVQQAALHSSCAQAQSMRVRCVDSMESGWHHLIAGKCSTLRYKQYMPSCWHAQRRNVVFSTRDQSAQARARTHHMTRIYTDYAGECQRDETAATCSICAPTERACRVIDTLQSHTLA